MDKGRLIITVGISGSGKSTWSHEKWLRSPSKYVIVSRDKIRELLFGYTEATILDYYNRKDIFDLEKQVTRYEDTIIGDGLNHGKNVIVDATHLTRKYIERFKFWNVVTEVVVFEIELEEALRRDLLRSKTVGDVIINKQYDRFTNLIIELAKKPIDFYPVNIIQNWDNEPCIIFDIDGTLSHMDRKTRSPYDWHKVGEDSLDIHVKAIVNAIGDVNGKIIICTGRDGVCELETREWLKNNDIPYNELYIRARGDQRVDWVVKEEMWRKIAEDNYIVGIFDDRLQVVRRARSLGLKVFNVEYGNF